MLGRERSMVVTRLRATVIVLLLLVVATGVAYLIESPKSTPTPSRSETTLSMSAPSSGPTLGSASWTTYHGDNARTGVDSASRSFESVSVAWRSGPFDGAIYAEPLVSGDRVIVATENNSVYSVKAEDGRVVWRAPWGSCPRF